MATGGLRTDLRRLLGAVGPDRERLQPPARDRAERLAWDGVPAIESRPEFDQDVRVGEDYPQSVPLALEVLFQPEEEGVYEAEWIPGAGTLIARGEAVLRAYRASDGLPYVQPAAFDLRVLKPLVARNRRLVRGDAVVSCAIPSLSLGQDQLRPLVQREVMGLAQATNAALLGLLDGTLPTWADFAAPRAVPGRLRLEEGVEPAVASLAEAIRAGGDCVDGEVLVVRARDLALAQGRVVPLEALRECDPLMTDDEGRAALVESLRPLVEGELRAEDLVCSELIPEWPSGPAVTLGVEDANGLAARIAAAAREASGARVDVVIAQAENGLAVRALTLGVPCLAATPLGATAGLVLYECMRVAAAAETLARRREHTPIVACRPSARRLAREGVGFHRGYPGLLDAVRERLIGFA